MEKLKRKPITNRKFMNYIRLSKMIAKPSIVLGIFCFAIGIIFLLGLSGFFGFEMWLFSLSYFELFATLSFVGFFFFVLGINALRISKQSTMFDQPYTKNIPTAPEYYVESTKSAEVFGRTRFIIQKQPELKDTLCILDPTMRTLFYAKHHHSWKTPSFITEKSIFLPYREMKTTDVRFEGVDGVLLGEIHEIPPEGMQLIKRWQIFNEKGELKGTARTKPKFIGSDWILEIAEGNVIVKVFGNLKKHDYKIITTDRFRQTIAGCSIVDKNSFDVNIMLTPLSPFLILSFTIILELSTKITTTRGWD